MVLPHAVDIPGWTKFLLVLGAGVIVSGLADFFLAQAGYRALAAYVWTVGYAGTIIVLWVVWLRPIDFEQP